MKLDGKRILITGGAVRVGAAMARAVALAGGDVVVHYGRSQKEAKGLQEEVRALGVDCEIVQADLGKAAEAAGLIDKAEATGPLFGLVNSAAIFKNLKLENSTPEDWQKHLDINLTAPFLLSQAFGRALRGRKAEGRIVNVLDWRALRPGADHLPYTISKAGLAALTRSLAVALAPDITVNGMAFGAILPPSDGGDSSRVLNKVPAKRWATLEEVGETLLFLLAGPSYITGEIIHLDGGRHLI
jgi:NAD(P)-dependent dehydrogenase (short-subunit alcohol dehydrogenase family)